MQVVGPIVYINNKQANVKLSENFSMISPFLFRYNWTPLTLEKLL